MSPPAAAGPDPEGRPATIPSRADAAARGDAWRDLAVSSGTVFAGPDMPAAAAGRIEPDDWNLALLAGPGGRVDAALPFRLRRILPLPGPRFADGFQSHFGPSSALAIREGAIEAAGGLVDRLAERAPVLRLRWQATDDTSFRDLAAAVRSRGGEIVLRNGHERAALLRIADPFGSLLAGGGARELRRQWRRLGERGELAHVASTDPVDLPGLMDAFLRLEASGWKGRLGSALASEPRRRDFAIGLVTAYGQAGGCRIDLLTLDGRPIAGLVTLRRGPVAATWKIAYDEDLSRFSPGAQILRLASEAFVADPDLAVVDSLAQPGHPLLERAWAGRIRIADAVLAMSPAAVPLARRLVGRMDAEAALRGLAVRIRSRLRQGRR